MQYTDTSRKLLVSRYNVIKIIALVLVVGFLVICLLWVNGYRAHQPNTEPVGICMVLFALLLVLMPMLMGYRFMSIPVFYLAYAWLYHFSLATLCSLDPKLWDFAPDLFRTWTQDGPWGASLVYSVLCFAMFVAGAAFALTSRKKNNKPYYDPVQCDQYLFKGGIVLAIFMVVTIIGVIFKSGGLEILSRTYLDNFEEGVFGRAFFMCVQIFAYAISFAVAGAPRKLLWLPVVIQLLATCVLLALGTRGPALVSILVMSLVLYRRGVRFKWLPTVLLIIFTFWLISFVKQGRDAGMLGGIEDKSKVSTISGILELGGTIRTVSLMIEWIDSDNSAMQNGQTYWLPFERAIGAVLPGVRMELDSDLRSFSNAVNAREPYLGGTVIGESYYNFGVFGGFVFLLLGFILGSLELGSNSPFSIAKTAVVAYALLYYVRDYFLPVPVPILIGLLVVLILQKMSSRAHLKRMSESFIIVR